VEAYELNYKGPRKAVTVTASRAAFKLFRGEPRVVKISDRDLAMIRRADPLETIEIAKPKTTPAPSPLEAARLAALTRETETAPPKKKADKKGGK
jgi:hypothetical protein